MKFPKHRADCFVVVREGVLGNIVSINGVFPTFEAADSFKEACVQEWIDKGFQDLIDSGEVFFNVTMTTYYDS